jgi:ketosteroid isomerase-like protein
MESTNRPTVDTVLQFLERINQHDADKLAELMAEDHVFIDSLGQSVTGRENMRLGWRGYYSFCPDYWVSHEEILSNGDLVAVFGAAGGTIAADGKLLPENKWRTSAAWRDARSVQGHFPDPHSGCTTATRMGDPA